MFQTIRQMHLGLYATDVMGVNIGSWRMPCTFIGSENFQIHKAIALKAEKAKFDLLFFADQPYTHPDAPAGTLVRLEPPTLLAALAAVTSDIGLVSTGSTTYTEPYNLARVFATIDHISGGRAGWNVVTGAQPGSADNFGRASHPPHAERYAIAEEYVAVAKRLWDSWEDGAIIMDRAAGHYADRTKMHRLDHKGRYFSFAGPLNVSRSPQGYPVIIQAGASEAGRAFAVASAEVIFTTQPDKQFALEMKEAVERNGRNPAHFKIMPGLIPIIGSSERDARAKLAELAGYGDPAVSMRLLSSRLGRDLSSYSLDGPVPDLPKSNMMQAYAEMLTTLAREKSMTLRELRDFTGASAGHQMLLGTPEQIAEKMEEWFVTGAADGYNIMPPWCPGALDDFINEVVPLLQKHGVFRKEYSGTTLRDRLGLPRPPHPNAR